MFDNNTVEHFISDKWTQHEHNRNETKQTNKFDCPPFEVHFLSNKNIITINCDWMSEPNMTSKLGS